MKFIFDLDGTICFTGKPVSDKIIGALSDVEAAGGEVIFASARPIRDMLPVINETFHHNTMIGGNGSLIAKGKRMITAESFKPTDVQKIMNLIEKYRGTYLIDDKWNYAYTGADNHPILNNVDPARLAEKLPFDLLDSVIKILILSSDNMELLGLDLEKLGVYINRHREESVLDISPNNVHKWTAIEKLGIEKHSYIAFGNDSNDITMFENSLHSVMIGSNESLSPYATEKLQFIDNYEERVVSKIQYLKNKYLFNNY